MGAKIAHKINQWAPEGAKKVSGKHTFCAPETDLLPETVSERPSGPFLLILDVPGYHFGRLSTLLAYLSYVLDR